MISLEGFSYQNLYPLKSGELAVRPGFREEVSASAIGGPEAELVAGFSVRSPSTGEVTHYLFSRNKINEEAALFLLDEEFRVLQEYYIGPVPRELIVTHAVLTDAIVANRELIICSPHFDTLYGIVGGGVTKATKVESVNRNTTAIEIPRGVCASVAGRVVIGSGRNIYFSDALAPRTFTGINVGALDGNITAIHAISGGLVVVTESGAYFLPVEAVGSAQKVDSWFSQYSSYRSTGYLQTCEVDGIVFGLTSDGLQSLVDSREVSLAEPRMPRGIGERLEWSDFRLLHVFAGERGPLVSARYGWAVLDLQKRFQGWWTCPEGFDVEVTGVLAGELYVTRERILRVFGNTELGNASVIGVAAGQIPTSPELSPVVREVTTSADGFGKQYAAVRGQVKSADTPQSGLVIGTSKWGADAALREKELRSRRHRFAVRTDDITLEIATERPYTRLGNIDLVTRGRGRRRYTN